MATVLTLPVIVKVEVAGEAKGNVVTYFPTQPGTTTGTLDFEAYSQLDGWISASHHWLGAMRPATPDETLTAIANVTTLCNNLPGPKVELIPYRRRTNAYRQEYNAIFYRTKA